MKIKLLVAPSIVVIIIVLLIWQIYPAVTDPITRSGVLEKRAELSQEKANLETVRGKSEKVHALATELSSSAMTPDKTLVMDFLPGSIEEYKIIDNLNYLVLKDELQGLAISVAQPAAAVSPAQADASGTAGEQAAVAPELKATTFTVSFSVQGSYEKIKSVFQKIYNFRRFNRVLTLKIEPADKVKEGSSNLKATASLEFAFMKESGSFTSVGDSSLAKTDFDREAISNISKMKEVPVLPDIQLEKTSRPNPFLP